MNGETGAPRRRGGVPSSYSEAVGEAICARLVAGERLGDICAGEGMPRYGTVMKWRREIPAFRARYTEARERQADDRRAAGLPATLGGRPGRYSPALAERICAGLAAGAPLPAVCAEPGMPGARAVFNWLERHPEFRAAYGRARAMQAHAVADEVLATLRREDLIPADKQARLKGLAWVAGRLAPVKYGGTEEADEAGDGDALIEIVVNGGWEGTG